MGRVTMNHRSLTFFARLGSDSKQLLIRIPEAVKYAANLEQGDYLEVSLEIFKRRSEEVAELTPEPKTKVTPP